jgi:hypothetical protein
VPLAALAALVVGAAILVAAPGNVLRAEYATHTVGVSLRGVLLVARVAAPDCLLCVGLGVLAGLPLAALAPWRGTIAWPLSLAAAAFGALLPFLALPDFAGGRANFAVGCWSGAAAACFAWRYFARLKPGRRVGSAVVAALAITYVGFSAADVAAAWQIRGPVLSRGALLAASPGRAVDVSPIGDGRDVQGLEPDPSSPINTAVADYFGLASVRLTS